MPTFSRRTTLAAVLTLAVLPVAACTTPAQPQPSTTSAPVVTPTGFPATARVAVSLKAGSPIFKPVADGLTKLGLYADMNTSTTGAEQHAALSEQLKQSPKVVIVQSLDAAAIKDDLAAARKAGAVVIAVSSLPADSADVDFFVGTDPKATGTEQAKALITGVTGMAGTDVPTVELFAGQPDDAIAKLRFESSWAVVKSAMESKQVNVASGEKDFAQAAAATPADAAKRLSTLVTGKYPAKGENRAGPNGILAPDDVFARALTAAAREAKVSPLPFTTGAGSEPLSVVAMMGGQQGMTTLEDPSAIAAAVVTITSQLQKGKIPTVNEKDGVPTGARSVPAELVPMTPVTRGTARAVYAKIPELAKIVG